MKRSALILVLAAGSVIFGAPLTWAQAQTPDDYILRAGDRIAITVWDQPDYSVPEVEIRPDGKVAHPFAGEVTAAGLTSSQLADAIRKALLKEMRQPVVSVMVVGFKENWLFVTGAVQKPGAFPQREDLSIQQALASAGGPLPEADMSRALIIHQDGTREEVDLDADDPERQRVEAIRLGPGCTLVLRERPPANIAVMGAVVQPGMFEIPPKVVLRLSDAIALAGGFIEEADPSAARFVRTGERSRIVDLDLVLSNIDSPANTELKHGDALIVPAAQPLLITVLGAVMAPSVVPLKPGGRMSEAIALAGGLAPFAHAEETTLMRVGGTVSKLDLRNLLESHQPEADLALQTGDTIIVGSLGDKQVTVLGAVTAPGRYPLSQVQRLSDLIAVAQPTPDAATTASLIRPDGKTVEVDLDDVVRDKQDRSNVKLRDGDTLLIESAIMTVAVLGPVGAPGQFSLKPNAKFSDAIALAGGLNPNVTTRTAIVMRSGTEPINVDLNAVLKKTDAKANIPLQDRDTIVVQESMPDEMVVLGSVRQQTKIPLDEEDRISDAIAKAGGLDDKADRRVATIMRRDGSVIQVDLEGVLERRDQRADIEVLTGDTLVINAKEKGHAAVLGDVPRPGLMEIDDEHRVSDLIARAGGTQETADLQKTTLKRADGTLISLDLARIIRNAATDENVPVQNGDTLYVPSRLIGRATILGAVNMPGAFDISKDERASTLIGRARGLKESANYGEARIIQSGGETVVFDARACLDTPAGPADPLVVDGDTITIAEVEPVTVLGAVGSTGLHVLQPGVRASTVIAKSGGPRPTADLRNALVMHRDGSSDGVDLEKVLVFGDHTADKPLQPGDILLVPYADFYVSVIGAVQSPGRHEIRPGDRVTDVIARARGLAPDADQSQCTMLRGTTRIVVELGKIMKDKDSEANIQLRDGDTVIVDALEPMKVSILGNVRNESQVELQPGAKLSDAIARVGGLDERADAAKVKIVRGQERQIVDLTPLLRGEELADDPVLEGGDLVVVPQSTHTVSVLGLVRKPGIYHFRPGDRLLDAVNGEAGGWIHGQSAPNRTILTRTLEGELRWTNVDLLAAVRRPQDEQNPVLVDGDILYIPEVSKRTLDNVVKSVFPVASFLRLFDLIN